MLNTLLRQSKHFADEGYSSIAFLTNLGIAPTSATILLALIGVVAVTVIFYTYHNSSLLTLFAIASVIGRVSTYHRFYDNVMLIFFLLALLKMTFKNLHRLNILVLMLVGISLWLPGKTVGVDNLGILVQFFFSYLFGVWALFIFSFKSSFIRETEVKNLLRKITISYYLFAKKNKNIRQEILKVNIFLILILPSDRHNLKNLTPQNQKLRVILDF
ncbi:MAG: hypothetical protein IGR93_04445 [Hydrococcus sp. C42_A2020_068]|uniref:hypothetical protein n=1 Tax=Pleurocapsa sp. PCC 7327 TaxID=118163 RepID=UPI00029FFB47|nr:hypothetical protein [Pleurocapsa sp. PCC 7327]AFY77127.1 hypothetical protein Ple7327_1774 [Pleurocapsa sp. PCC 7327]MBF2019368.1 hypothetical protein [Hydrococcus sp. C42_A2020_068]